MGTLAIKTDSYRQGLGAMLVVNFAKMISNVHDFDTIWYIAHTNVKSNALAKKFSAHKMDDFVTIGVKPKPKIFQMARAGLYQIFY